MSKQPSLVHFRHCGSEHRQVVVSLSILFEEAGKRVLLVLQDPKTENKKHSRTQEFFRNIHGTVVAWFPTGTIPIGHACGWSDSHTSWKGNSHSWILKDGNQIRPPTDVHQDSMQRHANLMNTSPVRFILFPHTTTILRKS